MFQLFVHQLVSVHSMMLDENNRTFFKVRNQVFIYANEHRLSFADPAYWEAVQQIQWQIREIEENRIFYPQNPELYEVGRVYEFNNQALVESICDRLNFVAHQNFFEPLDLLPYNLEDPLVAELPRFAPGQSVCPHEISAIFRDPQLLGEIWNRREGASEVLMKKLKTELEFVSEINSLKIKLQQQLNAYRLFREENLPSEISAQEYCVLAEQYIRSTLLFPNDPIRCLDYPRLKEVFCMDEYATPTAYRTGFVQVFALNIAYELGILSFFCELLEQGNFRFAIGHFVQPAAKGWFKRTSPIKEHNAQAMLSFVQQMPKHYRMLRNKLADSPYWNPELEKLFPKEK